MRLSAGREDMSEETQALCFFAGANSIFHGEKLLTTANPDENADQQLFDKLGIKPEVRQVSDAPQDPSVADVVNAANADSVGGVKFTNAAV